MLDKYQDYDKAKAARAGLPDSGPSKAEEGLAETPAKTGGEANPPRRKSVNDASDPQAVLEEMRNQDA